MFRHVIAVILNSDFNSKVNNDRSPKNENYNLGVSLVLGASAISGLSTALTQRALVAEKPRETVFFSAELAVYGILALIAHELSKTNVSARPTTAYLLCN